MDDAIELRRIKRIRILNMMKQYLFKLKQLNLTLEDVIFPNILDFIQVMLNNAFPKKSYEREKSKIFFDHLKANNLDNVFYML